MNLLTASVLLACQGPAPLPELPLPQARHGHRVEPVAGGLLAFGGFAAGGDRKTAVRQTLWLAPDAEAWQPRAAMKTGRSFFGSAVVDGVVHAVGDGVERYDFENDRWLAVAPAEGLPHSHFAAAALGRELFVLGGLPADRGGFAIVDVDTGDVRSAEPPPGFARGDHFQFLFAFAGELHAIGGFDGAAQRSHCVRSDHGWRTLPPPPVAMWSKFGGGAIQDGALYLFGEFGGHRYEPEVGWQQRATWDDMLAMSALVAVGGEIRAIGGLSVGERGRRVLRLFDPRADRWRVLDR